MFTHLHSHTDYSLLDGLSKIKEYVSKVKKQGMTSCAITDHGTAAGLVDFYDECKAQGIKPILGCEVYEAPEDRFNKSKNEEGDAYFHLILLVKNEQGYKNLCKLVTRSNTEGFYYKPRIDMKLLEEYHEGLICLSACIGGRIPKAILRGKYQEASNLILKYKEIFGEDFYLEIQNHGIKEEADVAEMLLMLGKKHDVKVVATNDCHYVNHEDAEAHEWLLCLQTGKKLNDPTHMRYEGDYSVKSEAEMKMLFPNNPEVFDNTQEIADKCNFDFVYGQYRMPKVVIPEEWGDDYYGYLESEAWKGFEKRYPVGHPKREEAKPRLEYELSIIKQMGFAEYFIDTRKTILWSHNNGIMTGPGRGCIYDNGLIYTKKGLKRAKDIRVNDILYDCRGNPSKVKKVFKYEVEEILLEISAYLTGKTTFTKDHKFLTVPTIKETDERKIANGFIYKDEKPISSPIWKQAKDLQIGDWLLFPRGLSSQELLNISLNFKFDGNYSVCYISDEYIYIRIREIKEILYKGYVYDFSVDTNNEPSYTTNVCIVHNSGAGSAMNYCLGITDIEPLKYNLLFERFLNPSRISMPDIDTDYEMLHKDEVIAFEAESNGKDKFAKIRTFMTMAAKGVVRDCVRVNSYPVAVGENLSKLIGEFPTLQEAWEGNPDLRDYINKDVELQKIWNIALKLEGVKKSASDHPCGVIPTSSPCEELFPCSVEENTGYLVCEYNMAQVEHLGNLKKDLLMLRNLTIINIANSLIKEKYKIEIPLWTDEILNDKEALELISDGETLGVFQLESDGMSKFMRELKPSCFEDIIAGVALYRPINLGI